MYAIEINDNQTTKGFSVCTPTGKIGLQGRDKLAFDQTKELINRLSQEGRISKVQLMKQLFDADSEELLQLLRESENE